MSKIEAVWKGDREAWVGENRIFMDQDNVICVTDIGEIDGAIARAIIDVVDNKLKSLAKGDVGLLIDLNRGGKISAEARMIFREAAEKVFKGKMAYFGMHPVARVIASFMMGVTRKQNMRFFKTREEALAWLKEKG